MTDVEKAYQYFVVAIPENEEQAKAYFWARKALQSTLTPPNETEYREYVCPSCHHMWLEDRDATDYPEYCPGCGDPLSQAPNEPLSIEQLRQMDGEPVYIVFLPDTDGEKLQFWALVAVDEWGEVYLMNNLGGAAAYEEVWANIEAVFRRPPEGAGNA